MAAAVLSLAVTSSTSVVGVAVGTAGDDPSDTTSAEVETDRRHAEVLTPLIARTLADAAVALGDIEQFVVDVGPGRFTGLRVGLATVRALALATSAPVVALTSLEALAWTEPARPLVAVVDARRSEVFQQRFDSGTEPAGPAVVGPPERLADQATGATVVGDGADRYAELYDELDGAAVIPGCHPSAAAMITASAARPAGPGSAARPVYLRQPDVAVNVKTRHTLR